MGNKLAIWQKALVQRWSGLTHAKQRAVSIVGFIVITGLVGSIIVQSHAATYVVPLEAESSSPSGNAAALSGQSGTSGGGMIKFGNGATTPPPVTPPSQPPTGTVACGNLGGSGTTVAASGVAAALNTAKAGDTILVTGSGSISITGKAFSGSPVVIKSASPLGTTLNSFQITNSSGIVVQGFKFGPSSDSTYMKIASSTNIKVMRNLFDGKGITTSQSSIVTSGTSDTIDIGCNEFKDKYIGFNSTTKVTGSFIKTQYDAPNMTKNLHIYGNYFHNIAPFLVNGVPAGDSDREAIAMGIADSQSVVTNNVIEGNLFEDCDGENEIVTVKTSKNIFRKNTFKNSMGSLSLRLGNDSQIYDNYFYGVGASATPTDPNYQTGGIRVYGSRHVLRNNFMRDLTGISYRLPILLDSGDTNNSVGGDSHQVATANTATSNTILNSVGGVHIGSANYGIKPSGNTVSGNIVSASQGILFNDLGTTNTWSGNKAYATGSGVAVGGGTRSAAEVEVLLAAPSPTQPGFLSPSNVGTSAP